MSFVYSFLLLFFLLFCSARYFSSFNEEFFVFFFILVLFLLTLTDCLHLSLFPALYRIHTHAFFVVSHNALSSRFFFSSSLMFALALHISFDFIESKRKFSIQPYDWVFFLFLLICHSILKSELMLTTHIHILE